MKLAQLSDSELLSGIHVLLGSERAMVAEVVARLAEIEERRLHLTAAHPSLFSFCLRTLKMSEGEAFRRITAARLLRRFPSIYPLIESGSIHLTALTLLRDHLTEENHRELLAAAANKTKRELEALIAARFPKPDAPSLIRKLPMRSTKAASPAPNTGEPTSNRSENSPAPPASNPEPTSSPRGASPSTRTIPSHRPRIEPLSEARHKIQFTASAELGEKLVRACDLMSHANPTRDLAVVFERAVDALLKELERRKLKKTERPSRTARSCESTHIPNSIQREVFERDQARCTFVDAYGNRCDARAFVELDHIQPRALGGKHEASNLRCRCRAHNRLFAEQVFGRNQIAKRIRFRQRKRARALRSESCDSTDA